MIVTGGYDVTKGRDERRNIVGQDRIHPIRENDSPEDNRKESVLPENLWFPRLSPEAIAKAEALAARADALRSSGETILPPQNCVFRALRLTPPDAVRCVILGQDPYHTPGVANGLAFSANPGQKIPPSLRNIFRELSEDLGCPMPSSPDLTPWARRGVLLLNPILTVRAGGPGSHAKWGWQTVTGEILRLCGQLPQPVVFLLWGGHARSAASGLPLNARKAILVSSHPSPLGARQSRERIPAFLGSRPFSRANQMLIDMGGTAIDWTLP